MLDTSTLRQSYHYCHEVMRYAARNFYFGMRLLPEAKRRAMHTLYAFMRLCDDMTDSDAHLPDRRRATLERWRQDMHRALGGDLPAHPVWPAFYDMARRFGVPVRLFDDAIDGQLQDLVQFRYATFGELYRYCYRVASTVGIAAVHIWGYRDERAIKLAEERGVALQLTNILRDLPEDAARGRRYLPEEDLARFDCVGWDIRGEPPQRVDELLRFEADRARRFYEQSAPLEQLIEPDSRTTLQIMTGIYRSILDRIAAAPRLALVSRVGLSTAEKLTVVVRQLWRHHVPTLRGML